MGGAVLGGIIGKTVTKKDKGAAGAIIGGAIANETQNQNKTEIIGYENLKDAKLNLKIHQEMRRFILTQL